MLHDEIPLPGLEAPRSQLAVPLRVRGRVIGVMLAESGHDQFFSYDDEDALALICGQLASSLSLFQSAEALWKLASDFVARGRRDFTNRELRLAPELGLPGVQDNLEVRLVLLQRRLAERGSPLRIEKTGRGSFRLHVDRPLELEHAA